MYKKQFLTLSLLLCPFLHHEVLQAGVLGKLMLVSAVSGTALAGIAIHQTGERIKSRPLEEQTQLAKNGYLFLDGALESTQNVTDAASAFFSRTAAHLEDASTSLQEQREVILPEFIKHHHPAAKNIRELNAILTQSQPAPESIPTETEENELEAPVAVAPNNDDQK